MCCVFPLADPTTQSDSGRTDEDTFGVSVPVIDVVGDEMLGVVTSRISKERLHVSAQTFTLLHLSTGPRRLCTLR